MPRKRRCYTLMAVGAFVLLGMVFMPPKSTPKYYEPLTEKNKNALDMLKKNKQLGGFFENMKNNMSKKEKKEMSEMVASLLNDD